ncbi:MAG: MotA/TolQ/ExbB proton channel family protein [Thermodesulfovibrionales bacterium]|nr:MotA/TolQ/ExbB proton channel family protein [Thermodesulfovibrionales bacterium]
MDLMTVIGLVAGVSTIYYVLAEGNILHLLLNPVAFVLVFGGTFSATLISYPWGTLKHIFAASRFMFIGRKHSDEDKQLLIEQMATLAEKARLQGADSLQSDAEQLNDPFLLYSIQMLVDGIEHDIIKDNMEKRLLYSHQHNQKINGVFRTMATFSPIFGLLGTLIGVVQVLRNLSDPSSMGPAMAIAITTTFYGIFAANFLFLPSAIKLGELNENETLRREIVAEGVLSISQGDLPIMVRKKLNAFLISYLREHEQSASQ